MRKVFGLFVFLMLFANVFAVSSDTYNFAGVKIDISREKQMSSTDGILRTVYADHLKVENNNLPKQQVEVKICYPGFSVVETDGEKQDSCVVWRLDYLGPYDEKGLYVRVMGVGTLGEVKPEVEYEIAPLKIILPDEVESGDKVNVLVVDEDNNPIPYVSVKVSGPSGDEEFTSDENGRLTLSFDEPGRYVIKIVNTTVEGSVEVKPVEQESTITATITDNSSEVKGAKELLPVFIGLVILAVVLIGLLIFYSTRSEPEGDNGMPTREETPFSPRTEHPKDDHSGWDIERPDQHDFKEQEPEGSESVPGKYDDSSDTEDLDRRIEEIQELTRRILENRRRAEEMGYLIGNRLDESLTGESEEDKTHTSKSKSPKSKGKGKTTSKTSKKRSRSSSKTTTKKKSVRSSKGRRKK